jgi:DNA-binding NarL/FixJ family response regulator
MKTTRVILVDDHPAVRNGVRRILESAPDIKVVGEAGNGADGLRLVEELVPDVLLLDMEMPGMNGIDVAHRLQEDDSPVPILALSAFDDRQYVEGMLANGAAGYLVKEEAGEFLVEAVRGVARGWQGWTSPRVASKISPWKQSKDLESARDRRSAAEKRASR